MTARGWAAPEGPLLIQTHMREALGERGVSIGGQLNASQHGTRAEKIRSGKRVLRKGGSEIRPPMGRQGMAVVPDSVSDSASHFTPFSHPFLRLPHPGEPAQPHPNPSQHYGGIQADSPPIGTPRHRAPPLAGPLPCDTRRGELSSFCSASHSSLPQVQLLPACPV